jgi:uncharacterized protein YegL
MTLGRMWHHHQKKIYREEEEEDEEFVCLYQPLSVLFSDSRPQFSQMG